jgi:hypothetical protein
MASRRHRHSRLLQHPFPLFSMPYLQRCGNLRRPGNSPAAGTLRAARRPRSSPAAGTLQQLAGLCLLLICMHGDLSVQFSLLHCPHIAFPFAPFAFPSSFLTQIGLISWSLPSESMASINRATPIINRAKPPPPPIAISTQRLKKCSSYINRAKPRTYRLSVERIFDT